MSTKGTKQIVDQKANQKVKSLENLTLLVVPKKDQEQVDKIPI